MSRKMIFEFEHQGLNFSVSDNDWSRKQEIGSGKTGYVYKCSGRAKRDDGTTITAFFAAKVSKSHDINFKLQKEVDALKAIGANKNILAILASKEINGLLTFVSEYLPRTLAREIKDLRAKEDGGSVPLQHADAIAAAAFRAVAFSSRRGWVNRDIKDANIIMPGEEAKERAEENGGEGTSSTTGTTLTTKNMGLSAAAAASICVIDWDRATRATDEQEEGYIVGTPGYLPVEQLLAARKISSSSDVFSLSCVLAKMVLPRPIFNVAKGDDATFVRRCLSSIVVVMGKLEESDIKALGDGISYSDTDKPDTTLTEESCLKARIDEANLPEADSNFYLSFFKETLQHRPDRRPSPWSCFRRLFQRLNDNEKKEFDKLDAAERGEADKDLGGTEEAKKVFTDHYQ